MGVNSALPRGKKFLIRNGMAVGRSQRLAARVNDVSADISDYSEKQDVRNRSKPNLTL